MATHRIHAPRLSTGGSAQTSFSGIVIDQLELPHSNPLPFSPPSNSPSRTKTPLSTTSRKQRRRLGTSTLEVFFLCLVFFGVTTSIWRWVVSSRRLQDADHASSGPPGLDIVGVSLKPSCVTRQSVLSLNRYLRPRHIHVVTTSAPKCAIFSSFAPNVLCHVQDSFLPGLSTAAVDRFLRERLGVDGGAEYKGRRLTGWYTQQFLKLGAVQALPDLTEHFVVWDLDMIPLAPPQLLRHDAPGSPPRTVVNIGGSMAQGYMTSYTRLLKSRMLLAPDGSSFVTHWMVVYKPYMRQFLQELSSSDVTGGGGISNGGDISNSGGISSSGGAGGAAVGGSDGAASDVGSEFSWPWRILSAVDRDTVELGFSEYAAYISWVGQHYPASQYILPKKTWIRHPFGEGTVKFLRHFNGQGLCCPSWPLLRAVAALGFQYTGYEVGHIRECRYNDSASELAYGLTADLRRLGHSADVSVDHRQAGDSGSGSGGRDSSGVGAADVVGGASEASNRKQGASGRGRMSSWRVFRKDAADAVAVGNADKQTGGVGRA